MRRVGQVLKVSAGVGVARRFGRRSARAFLPRIAASTWTDLAAVSTKRCLLTESNSTRPGSGEETVILHHLLQMALENKRNHQTINKNTQKSPCCGAISASILGHGTI